MWEFSNFSSQKKEGRVYLDNCMYSMDPYFSSGRLSQFLDRKLESPWTLTLIFIFHNPINIKAENYILSSTSFLSHF